MESVEVGCATSCVVQAGCCAAVVCVEVRAGVTSVRWDVWEVGWWDAVELGTSPVQTAQRSDCSSILSCPLELSQLDDRLIYLPATLLLSDRVLPYMGTGYTMVRAAHRVQGTSHLTHIRCD